MRIALYHNLPSGGAKRAVYEWTRRLVAFNHIDVFSLSTADHLFCDIRPFVHEHRVFNFTLHKQFDPPWGRLNRVQRWRDLIQLTRLGHHISHEINTRGYDVVFAHPCLYTYIPIFLRFVQIPTVYYLHEPFGPTFERPFQRPYIKKSTRWREISKRFDPLVALFERSLENARVASIRATAQLLANSRYTQRQMKLQYDVDTPVCYYGVNVKDFSPMPGVDTENCVISVGQLTPRKGFDFLVESLAYVPAEKRPTLKLVSNGVSSRERHYVENLAAVYDVKLNIQSNLNASQLAFEYNKARLCVYAPISEPFGLVPLESMACGTPVVAVAEGGVCETVVNGETGILTKRDQREFAQAVIGLLDDPEQLMKLSGQGRTYIERKWQWDHSVRCLQARLIETAQRSIAETAQC